MKTLILIMSLMALGLMGVGCSKSNSQANNNVGTTATVPGPVIIDPVPGGGTAGSPAFAGGSTVAFIPRNMEVMNAYLGDSPTNNPTNMTINVNLTQAGSGRYAGTVSIAFMDNGFLRRAVFTAGSGTNVSGNGLYDTGKLEAEYNYWFNFQNQLVFTGFFQDSMGAVTLTLTPESISTGGGNDGEPIINSTYKGSISFKNFCQQRDGNGQCVQASFATQYQRACWFMYNGPYDCRSNVIQTKCGLTPGAGAGYTVLGTFTGINVKSAFNLSN